MSRGPSTVSVTIEAPNDEQNKIENDKNDKDSKITWTTMTPQQISIWIDKYVRLIFIR